MYDRALDADEVAGHRKGSFGTDTGLLAWWSFDRKVDAQAVSWLAGHYDIRANPTDSLDLLQFLPTFLKREEKFR